MYNEVISELSNCRESGQEPRVMNNLHKLFLIHNIQREAAFSARAEEDLVMTTLWHGTSTESARLIARLIARHNFDVNLCNTSGGNVFGCGTYFTNEVKKACLYSPPNGNKLCCIILCKVLVGSLCFAGTPTTTMNNLPTYDPNTLRPINCAVDTTDSTMMSEFVLLNNTFFLKLTTSHCSTL